MNAFQRAFAHTIGLEGGYVNNPDDPGGETIFGITRRDHPDLWETGRPTLEQAQQRYRDQYWTPINVDGIAGISIEVAMELFDTGVNVGPGTAAKWLQRSLNACNRNQQDYSDITVDGGIGPASIAALRSFYRRWEGQADAIMLRALNVLQGAYYFELAETNVKYETFFNGWLLNRVKI